MKLSPRSFALLVAGFLLGSLLAPVAAQQIAPRDGQVAVRSDGAVYVISNGQKRWVATIIITDEELNAIPEAEPIYTGLAPMGASGSSSPAAKPTEQPKATPTSTPSSSSSSSSSDNDSSSDNGSSSDNNDNGSSSGDLFIEEVTYDEEVDQGDDWHITAVINREREGKCELTIEYDDGEEQDNIDDETPDSDGVCEFTVEVPRDAETGPATWTLTVTDGDDEVEDSDRFEVNER